jgi:cbb3-type cytochrome oxidase cytochrome c subunit
MTRSEAEKVIRMLLSCDNGCHVCAEKLIRWFKEEFPRFAELAERMFREDFGFGTDE